MRTAPVHGDGQRRAPVRQAATGKGRAGHGGGQFAPKAGAQIAGPVDTHRHLAGIGIEPQTRVLKSKEDVGQAEGFGGIRIAELVQFAQAQHAVAIGTAHPHAARAHRGDLWRQTGESDVDLYPVGGQIRIGRVAQQDMFDPLGTQAHISQIIIGLHPAPVQFAADEIFRDRRALRPQASQHQCKRPGADTQPA